jgi:hypothetical protein
MFRDRAADFINGKGATGGDHETYTVMDILDTEKHGQGRSLAPASVFVRALKCLSIQGS